MRARRPYSIGAHTGKAAAGARAMTIALALLMSGRGAHADAGPETDNALATLCGIVESSAKAEGLPVDFFTKLIWRESAFRPAAVSPAGAQGVAQFMPGTANERGLIDPFDPASAIPASARFLNELKLRFGNLGLAAAAYNAGPTALGRWLAGKSPLPFETEDYVLAITGRGADEWRSGKSPAAASPPPVPSCLSLIASLRTTTAASPVVSGWFAPWGVQIAASFSRASAMRAFARVQHDFYPAIGGKNPFVLGSVVRSRGFRPFYRVRIGAQSRREADKICAGLEAAGGACVVLRS
jgi:Transglycosylase SLT domain/SPOR domain